MSKPSRCEHVFIYETRLGGFDIVCRTCGELRGGSDSADRVLLAGFNRNQRRHDAAVKRAASRKGKG